MHFSSCSIIVVYVVYSTIKGLLSLYINNLTFYLLCESLENAV